MNYRISQAESRARYLTTYDSQEASKYDAWITAMTAEDHEACIADMRRSGVLSDALFDGATDGSGLSVLDAGSGTGGLSLALVRVPGLRITALEPSADMTDLLKAKPELESVSVVHGFCDHEDDRDLFEPGSFDLIVSRQLTNCLYDPVSAFRNWRSWLRPGGRVVVMDGLFGRSDWSEPWDEFVDHLPLSACGTTAMVPYLLETSDFRVDAVSLMTVTNALPLTRTKRYIVAATKANPS